MVHVWRNLLTLLTISPIFVSAADISPMGESKGYEMVLLDGPITLGDAQRVKEAFSKVKPTTTHLLMIDSPGGNVHEAMAIGDYLETNEIGVVIPKMMSCKSSCVLILAGGDSKNVQGKVGIHRPFITDLELPEGSASTTLNTVQNEIRAYLEKKGIAPSLVDDMFSVEPHKMQILSSRDVSRYRLDQTNYLKQEQTDIKIAKSLGLTRLEYVAKQAQINAECSQLTNQEKQMNCINTIMGTNLK